MTRRRRTARLLAAALVLFAARAAAGAGYEVAEQGVVASSTGGAGTARDRDPAAAWYNPAALADGGGLRLAVGVMAVSSMSFAEAGSGQWRFQTVQGVSTPPHLHASWAHGPVAAGVALLVPFGGGVTWPEDWIGRYEVVSSSLIVLRAAPFLAWRMGAVRASAGFHYDSGRLDVAKKLAVGSDEGDVHLSLRGHALGYHASLFVEAGPRVALGLAYKRRTTIPLSGDADFTLPGPTSPDGGVTSAMKMPDRLVAGVRARLPPLAVVVDTELVWWDQNDRLAFDFAKRSTPDAEEMNEWHKTVSLRLGVEVAAKDGFTARAGLFYDPTPVPDQTFGPTAPDSLRTGVTLGLGRHMGGGWTLDAFYEYLRLSERRAAPTSEIDAVYGGMAHFAGVGLSYQRPGAAKR